MKFRMLTALLLALILLLSGCSLFPPLPDGDAAGGEENDAPAATAETPKGGVLPTIEPEDAPSNTEKLVNHAYYASTKEMDYEVHELYIKIFPTYDEEGELLTREAFDKHRSLVKTYNPTLNAHIWDGNPDAFVNKEGKVGYGDAEINSTIRVHGNSSRGHSTKSFKIKLLEPGAAIFGTDALNLNKHLADITRCVNKVSLDAMQLLPEDYVSLETKFLKLYINDVDEDGNETGFQDQGLYTWVEQPNKEFLENHGLDTNGSVYKAISFEFREYTNEVRTEDDPLYDEELFSSIIKPMINPDHAKLREMLDAVNNYSTDFNEVFETYFDEDNYLTWMAFNILLGNLDAVAHNLLLYLPANSKKCYLLPWDCDASLVYDSVEGWGDGYYQIFGIHYFWSVPMHQRYFRIEGNLEKLNNKMDMLMETVFTEKNMLFLENQGKNILDNYLSMGIDVQMRVDYYEAREASYGAKLLKTGNPVDVFYPDVSFEIDHWYQTVLNNYKRYYKNLQSPTAGYVQEPQWENGEWVFRWDAAFDFQKDKVTYDFLIATDIDLDNVIFEKKDISGTSITVPELPEGDIYYQYVAVDENGNKQYPLNVVRMEDKAGNIFRRKAIAHYYNDGV